MSDVLANPTRDNLPQAPTDNGWQLTALSPELGDLSIPVGTSLRVGRQDSNDIVLASPRVSRQHAKLNRIGDNLYVQDLGSANGTFVNGERITKEAVKLQAGDELAFDSLAFVVMPNQHPLDEAQLADLLSAAANDTAPVAPMVEKTAPVEGAASLDTKTPHDPITQSVTQPVTTVYAVQPTSVTDAQLQVTPSTAMTQTVTETANQPINQPATEPSEPAIPSAKVASTHDQPVAMPPQPNKANSSNMTMIAVTLVVIIALAIVASLFL